MTVLDPSGRPWDSTPKRYIITTSHRVRHDPVLNGTIEQAQLNQSRVYDQVLEHFDRHAAFPFQAPAGTRRAKRDVSPGTRADSPVQSNRDRSPS